MVGAAMREIELVGFLPFRKHSSQWCTEDPGSGMLAFTGHSVLLAASRIL